MLGLIIVHHQAGVNDAGHPTQKSQEKTQEKAEDPPGHQDGDRRKNDAEEIAESFHKGIVKRLQRYIVT